MKTSKSILFSMAIVGLTLLGACNDNPQNEHGDHDHEHHEGMEDREGAHDHSQMEEHFDEVEQEEGMHSQHKSLRENFAHQDIIILDHPYQADQDVQKDLKAVVNAYLVLKNGLVNDDINAADKAAGDMAATVKAVEGGSLNSDGQKAWTQHASLYTDKLAELQHVKILKKNDPTSAIFSEIVYCTVKSFGLNNEMELFAAYCPMAFDGKGAYWVAETEKIKNPYFGEKMMNCGSIEEEL